jgi:hypothetical protein
MKVDVEGMEANVLRSWGKSGVRPWLLIVESTFPGSQTPTHDEWIEEVLKRGYREVFYDGLSRFFLHGSQSEREGAFKVAPNIFDGFAVAQHHFSASFMRSRLQDAEDRFRNELMHAVSLQEAAERKAADAIEDQQQARSELAATAAKEATLLARMLDSERNHAAAIDTLWRERQAAEAHLFAEFKAGTAELQQALDRARHEADEERKREREQLEMLRAAETAVRIEQARADERAESFRLELARQVEAHEQFRREVNETKQQERERLEVARAEYEKSRVEFERELQWHRFTLARAESVINTARKFPVRTWDRIGLLLRLSETGRVAQALSEWPRTITDASQIAPFKIESTNDYNGSDTVTQMSSGNPYLRANSLPELLAWDDVDFVRCAYVTVLGRQPDPEGETYYTERIRRGHSKMEILWQLRRSAEGPNHDPGIAGFDRALKLAAWARQPIVGWIVRFFRNGECDSPEMFRIRRLENELAILRRTISAGVTASHLPTAQEEMKVQECSASRRLIEPSAKLNSYEDGIFRQLAWPA